MIGSMARHGDSAGTSLVNTRASAGCLESRRNETEIAVLQKRTHWRKM